MTCLIYITCTNEKEATKIARQLVEQKLVACVNIFPKIKSIYSWQNKITEDNETVIIAKTKANLFTDVKEKVLSLHSYTNPCIIKLQIIDGNEKYLHWIDQTCSDKLC